MANSVRKNYLKEGKKTHYDPNGKLTSHTIEAHGIKGMKRSPWHKTFKHTEHLNKWADENDAEIFGTRDLIPANPVKEGYFADQEVKHEDKKSELKKYLDMKRRLVAGGNALSNGERKNIAAAKRELKKLKNEEIVTSVDDLKSLLDEAKGSVKRKYLGKQRGRTATGKKAHVIDVEPAIGIVDKNRNKTIPSGPLKKY